MLILTKYGPVELNVGDFFTYAEYHFMVYAFGGDTSAGMYKGTVPVILTHDPTKIDLSQNPAHQIVTSPGLVCHLLDELNVKCFICGQYGAFDGEFAAARLYEYRHGLPHDHVAEYVTQDGGEFGTIALDKTIDRELELEGLARDIAHAIQMARKKAGMVMEDQIEMRWQSADPPIQAAMKEFQNYVLDVAQAELVESLEVEPVVLNIDKKYNLQLWMRKKPGGSTATPAGTA
jgi:hypothetical protein